MATVTPTNLYVNSMGSNTLYIADFNSASGADIWSSGITDIVNVICSRRGAYNGSPTSVSWTASSGTVAIIGPASVRFSLWVVAGMGNQSQS